MQKPNLCVRNQLHLSDHITVFKYDLFSLSFRFYSVCTSTSLCTKKLVVDFRCTDEKPQALYTNTQTR